MLPLSLVSLAFFLGCLGLALNRAHLLSALLCLELLLVSLFSGMALWTTGTLSCPLTTATTLLLALSACEASTGLALLVSISRTHGADLMRTLNLLQC